MLLRAFAVGLTLMIIQSGSVGLPAANATQDTPDLELMVAIVQSHEPGEAAKSLSLKLQLAQLPEGSGGNGSQETLQDDSLTEESFLRSLGETAETYWEGFLRLEFTLQRRLGNLYRYFGADRSAAEFYRRAAEGGDVRAQ